MNISRSWLEGIPLGWVMYIEGGAVFNVLHFLGIGASIGQIMVTGPDAVAVDGSYGDLLQTFGTWISFRITDDLALMAKYYHISAYYDLSTTANTTYNILYYSSHIISLMATYSFSI